jgi:hypothetical protein
MDTVHGLTEKQLRNICRVILDEDFKSTPRSVCHMRGLIPYCQQNPELSIERHRPPHQSLARWKYEGFRR